MIFGLAAPLDIVLSDHFRNFALKSRVCCSACNFSCRLIAMIATAVHSNAITTISKVVFISENISL